MRYNQIKIMLALSVLLVILGSACTGTTASPTSAPKSPTQIPTELAAIEEPDHTPTSEPSPTPEPTEEIQPLVLTDGLGREVVFQEPPQKIVSLAPSNTEILYAIGAGSQVAARDAFSDYPEEVQQVTDIGGGWGDFDLETIVSLEPDLVLAAELTPPEQVQALENLGLTIYYLANPLDLEGLYDNLLVVARITGHEAEAEDLIATLKDRVTEVEEKVKTAEEIPLVFYELDGTDPNAPWTSGSGTFIDKLLSMAGGTNLGNVLDGSWAQISVEEIVTQNPDVIVLGDFVWGGITPEDVAARAGWESLAAVQSGRVYPFDDNLVSRPGPRLVDGLEELAQLLHPELFESSN